MNFLWEHGKVVLSRIFRNKSDKSGLTREPQELEGRIRAQNYGKKISDSTVSNSSLWLESVRNGGRKTEFRTQNMYFLTKIRHN